MWGLPSHIFTINDIVLSPFVCFSLRYWKAELQRKERGREARLWVAICKCLWWRILFQGVLLFLEVSTVVVCVQVILLKVK